MGGEDDSLMEGTKRWKTLARSTLAGGDPGPGVDTFGGAFETSVKNRGVSKYLITFMNLPVAYSVQYSVGRVDDK